MTRNEALLEAFATELRALRTKAGLSQEALALRAEVNRTYVAKLELAQNQPSLSVMLSLATALGVEPQDLVAGVVRRYRGVTRSRPSEAKRKSGARD